jgi:ABC-type dipeptide/oligopeptide/nickel transport system permease subunit
LSTVESAPVGPAAAESVPQSSRAGFWARLLRTRLAVPSLAVLVIVALCATFSGPIAPHDPDRQDYKHVLEKPSSTYLLGTDDLGRDILSRIVFGTRISVSVGIVAVGIALAIGVPLGLLAAFIGGVIDDAIMRVIDAMSAFPALVLALGISAALKPGLLTVMLAIGIVYVPQFARLVRGQALSVREQEFVNSARVLGARPLRLMAQHIWPNVTAPIIVQASLRVATAIVTEAGLSFLGVGVPPPAASWGAMLRSSYQYTETAPWLAVFPGAAIFLTVLATNLFGDALRSALDPRMRGRGV